MQDFSPVHKWISDNLLGGHGWVFNGSAAWLKDGETIVYTCRARDMRMNGLSHVACQMFTKEWIPSRLPILLPIKIDNIPGWNSGPEDARVFEYQSEVWIIFNMLTQLYGRQMHLYNVTKALAKQPTEPIRLELSGLPTRPVEKNWTPYVLNDKLYFIYQFVPLIILEADVNKGGCKCIYSENNKTAMPHFRGGTVALEMLGSPTPKVFGYLHTSIPFPPEKPNFYDRQKLPWPARICFFVYRAHRFELTLCDPPQLIIGPEITFFGRQIEQIYGHNNRSDEIIVNVDDQISLLMSPKRITKQRFKFQSLASALTPPETKNTLAPINRIADAVPIAPLGPMPAHLRFC
jgi:hypothetical protein